MGARTEAGSIRPKTKQELGARIKSPRLGLHLLINLVEGSDL